MASGGFHPNTLAYIPKVQIGKKNADKICVLDSSSRHVGLHDYIRCVGLAQHQYLVISRCVLNTVLR